MPNIGNFVCYLFSNNYRTNIYVVTFNIDETHSCCYVNYMIIEFDSAKREKTLLERGIDFADSGKVFDGLHFIARDDRSDYGEERFITVGLLDDRMVVIVWTPRNNARRIISMRYANDREISRYKKHLG
jgi:uncharacterized DUF497 family protein